MANEWMRYGMPQQPGLLGQGGPSNPFAMGLLGALQGLGQSRPGGSWVQDLGNMAGGFLQGYGGGQQRAIQNAMMMEQMQGAQEDRELRQQEAEAAANQRKLISNLAKEAPPEEQAFAAAFPEVWAKQKFVEPETDWAQYSSYAKDALNMGYQPGSPEFEQKIGELRKLGATNIDLSTPRGQYEMKYGHLPQVPGYQYQGEPGTESLTMAPVPGGKPARETAEAERAVAAEEEAAAARQETKVKKATTLLDEISEIRRLQEASEVPLVGGTYAGVPGAILQWLPGSAAGDIQGRIGTMKANIGFDRLQEMRDQSPTGGALGNVSNLEVQRLEAVAGDLSQSRSEEMFNHNLDRLEREYVGIVHGPAGEMLLMSPEELSAIDPATLNEDQLKLYIEAMEQHVE